MDKQKYLGIIFDRNLQWGPQLSSVCRTVSYYLHLLSLHRNSLTFDVLKILTESLVFSRIDYALPVWGPPLSQSQLAHLQRLQNRCIRVTKCLRKYDHVSNHRQHLNWLPVSDQIIYLCHVLLFS